MKSHLQNLSNSQIDFIYSSNTLEHIEKDEDILALFYDTLRPGGRLGIFVPALPFLYSQFDYQVGHYRRYSKKELTNKVVCANFQVLSIQYFDSIGVVAWMLLKFFKTRPNSKQGISLFMKLYDNLIFPCSRILDSLGFRRLIGKNLILIAEKPYDTV